VKGVNGRLRLLGLAQSTRRVEGLVRQLGIERISRSRVSEMAKELDEASRRSGPVHSTAVPTHTCS
jgi:hypothetical protein